MKIKSIKSVGKRKVYDISVDEVEHYILKNGVVTHNTGPMYSANQVFIIGKQQEKDGTELTGYNFIINVEKSRYVREKSKIPIEVSFEGGISKWSGLLDIALETGYVVKPSNGWYSKIDSSTGEVEDKKFRKSDTNTKDFWMPLLTNKQFREAVENMYMVSHGDIMKHDDTVEDVYDNIVEDDDSGAGSGVWRDKE